MSLSVGIVGLPNVGKSTLFNALTKKQQAAAENYPFCTIEPNSAIVEVQDSRLEELAKIVNRSAGILNMPITEEGALEIASRSRGTPRIANALLRRVRDFAQVKGNGYIDLGISQYALEALNIDRFGLDEIDNKILLTIIDKFKGGPVGINTIATAIGEDGGTVEEVYEPFLIKEGFIKRTPRGREVTELAYRHLGRTMGNRYGNPLQGDLFE